MKLRLASALPELQHLFPVNLKLVGFQFVLTDGLAGHPDLYAHIIPFSARATLLRVPAFVRPDPRKGAAGGFALCCLVKSSQVQR